jgi:hypothetical protein
MKNIDLSLQHHLRQSKAGLEKNDRVAYRRYS